MPEHLLPILLSASLLLLCILLLLAHFRDVKKTHHD